MKPSTRTRALLVMTITVGGLAAALAMERAPGDLALRAAAPQNEVAIADGAADRLAGAIRIRTVSSEQPADFDAVAFQSLHAYLRESFPRVHARLRREPVAGHSLLYTWAGSDPTLKPIVLAGHLDVVPVEADSESQWSEHPFSGRIADGYIWGRGAIDNKASVIGILEAVEMLLAEDFHPARTVYLAFGHDEEVGGTGGARQIAAVLADRGVQAEMVLDEGGIIAQGIVPGISAPVALVGVAEKGFVSVELTATGTGGHSSVPREQGAIGVLAGAIARLENTPVTARFDGATHQMFEAIGPYLPWAQRVVFANLWATRRLVVHTLAASPGTNAMIRTTTAPTILQAGTKDNVLPTSARAVVNFRILPGESVSSTVDHVKRAIDDQRIEVRVGGRFTAEPSALSSSGAAGFQLLARAIHAQAPDAIVAPYLVVGVTDSRYYAGLSQAVFRFQPLRLTPADLERMHGIDERIAISNYYGAIRTYREFVRTAATTRR